MKAEAIGFLNEMERNPRMVELFKHSVKDWKKVVTRPEVRMLVAQMIFEYYEKQLDNLSMNDFWGVVDTVVDWD